MKSKTTYCFCLFTFLIPSVQDVQMDKVGINQFLKASIDIIRLAANPKATWSAESIRNAVSWLEKTEAWAKQEHINKDEVHDLMRVST